MQSIPSPPGDDLHGRALVCRRFVDRDCWEAAFRDTPQGRRCANATGGKVGFELATDETRFHVSANPLHGSGGAEWPFEPASDHFYVFRRLLPSCSSCLAGMGCRSLVRVAAHAESPLRHGTRLAQTPPQLSQLSQLSAAASAARRQRRRRWHRRRLGLAISHMAAARARNGALAVGGGILLGLRTRRRSFDAVPEKVGESARAADCRSLPVCLCLSVSV